MYVQVITPPAVEPVTSEEVKAYLKIAYTQEDALIDMYIKAAREMLEAELNRAFITQTVQETFDGGESVIRLQRSPVASITSVTVTQYDKTTETVDESLYTQHGNQLKYFTWLNNRESEWPHGRGFSALSVVYVCGYGADASAVPGPIKLGLLQLIAFLYEHRGDVSAAFPEQIKKTVRNYYVPMFL